MKAISGLVRATLHATVTLPPSLASPCRRGKQWESKKEDDQPITGQELDDQNFINSMHGGWVINHKAIKVQCCKH